MSKRARELAKDREDGEDERGREEKEREREMPDKRRKSEQWVRVSIDMPSPTTGTIQGRLGLH
jgi:hypothetical protein